MKTRNLINYLTIFLLFVSTYAVMGFNYSKSIHNPSNRVSNHLQNRSIVGAWICEKDSRWKLVFTANNKCNQYNQGMLTETDSVIISNTSPQCGAQVSVDSTTSYLQLINIADTSDHVCYEINGITNTILSLSPVWTGGVIIFDKQ